MSSATNAIAPGSGDVYYTGKYWNDFVDAQKEINRRATGDPTLLWYDHFFRTHKKFKKVLMLNCGNGWPEREMLDKGYLEGAEVIGVDYSKDLLAEARDKAKGLPFRYYYMDINEDEFPEDGFDLVINHAAAHHIAKLDKVFQQLVSIMKPNGLFLNYDYVGAHRNQYPLEQWQQVFELNRTLSPTARQYLSYPHLPTMLATDPSEAVHSELIIPTMKRYFSFQSYTPIGGALAYPILTHNEALQKASRTVVKTAIHKIMTADAAYLAKDHEHTMFAYWVAKPSKTILSDTKTIEAYKKDESKREKIAAKNNGYYYNLSLVQTLYLELDELRITKQHKESTIQELQQKIHNLEQQLNAQKSRPRYHPRRIAGKAKRTITRR